MILKFFLLNLLFIKFLKFNIICPEIKVDLKRIYVEIQDVPNNWARPD